jgi:hypothetical protein
MSDDSLLLPKWLEIPPFWKHAVTHGKSFIFNELSDMPIATFFPTFDTIICSENKLSAYLVQVVRLWPYLKARVSLARADSSVSLLTQADWHDIMGSSYLSYNMRPDEKKNGEHNDSIFWKHGGPKVFGQTLSDNIRNGSVVPEFGLLECGCEPTLEKLADPLLAESIAFRIAMENLAHTFCLLVQPVLKKALPCLKDPEGKEYAMPDFDSAEDLANPTIDKVLRDVLDVLGNAREGQSPPWHSADVLERYTWTRALHRFIITHVHEWPELSHFEEHQFATREAFAAGAPDDERHARDVDLQRWEMQVVLMWMHLLGKHGWPPPLLLPGPISTKWECVECRNAVLDQFASYAGFEDDDDD